MKLTRLKLTDVRAFRDAEFDFVGPDGAPLHTAHVERSVETPFMHDPQCLASTRGF